MQGNEPGGHGWGLAARRAGCLLPALALTLLIGFIVLWGMAAGGMLQGV